MADNKDAYNRLMAKGRYKLRLIRREYSFVETEPGVHCSTNIDTLISALNFSTLQEMATYLRETKVPGGLMYDFGRQDLSGADFSGAKLTRADMRGSNLAGVSFVDADLSNADMTGANMRKADFSRANMTRVKVYKASIRGATFGETTVSGTNFYHTREKPGFFQKRGMLDDQQSNDNNRHRPRLVP